MPCISPTVDKPTIQSPSLVFLFKEEKCSHANTCYFSLDDFPCWSQSSWTKTVALFSTSRHITVSLTCDLTSSTTPERILHFSYSTFLFLPSPRTELLLFSWFFIKSVPCSLKYLPLHLKSSNFLSPSIKFLISSGFRSPWNNHKNFLKPNKFNTRSIFFFHHQSLISSPVLTWCTQFQFMPYHHTMRSPPSTTMKPNFSEQLIMIISVFIFISLSNIRYC